jgi:uncharacterized protein
MLDSATVDDLLHFGSGPRGTLPVGHADAEPSTEETAEHRGESMQIQELVEFMAKALVDVPDSVEVREIEGEQSSVVELRVAKEDLGKVIGKQGRTARSMRTVLSAAAAKLKKRVVLDIIE